MRPIGSTRIPRNSIASKRIPAVPGGSAFTPFTANFRSGTSTFTPPAAGLYKFIGWGGGGGVSSQPGGGGGYFEVSVQLTAVDAIPVSVSLSTGIVSVTFPGRVVQATKGGDGSVGVPAPGGIGVNGDVNLTGGQGGDTDTIGPTVGQGTGAGTIVNSQFNGGSAPGVLPFRGGNGGDATTPGGGFPGGGMRGAGAGVRPGDPLLIVMRMR